MAKTQKQVMVWIGGGKIRIVNCSEHKDFGENGNPDEFNICFKSPSRWSKLFPWLEDKETVHKVSKDYVVPMNLELSGGRIVPRGAFLVLTDTAGNPLALGGKFGELQQAADSERLGRLRAEGQVATYSEMLDIFGDRNKLDDALENAAEQKGRITSKIWKPSGDDRQQFGGQRRY